MYGGNSRPWFHEIPVFSLEYRVIAFDKRGMDWSDKPYIPYNIEMMTADTAGLLEAIGINAVHIASLLLPMLQKSIRLPK